MEKRYLCTQIIDERMLKEIIVRDFFSFKGTVSVKLNKGVNLLLGINGSGKTSFLNALRLLVEGVAGDGVEKLVQEKWGGYGQIINCCGEREAPHAQITYVFDKDCLNRLSPSARFKSDVHYRITLSQSGNSYNLTEKMWAEDDAHNTPFVYLDFRNGNGKISGRTEGEGIRLVDYSAEEISGRELAVRQVNDPQRFLPTYTLRKAVETMAVYGDFHVGEGSRLRQPVEYSTDKRLRKNGENLTQIINLLKTNYTFDYRRLEETFLRVNPHFRNIEISNPYGQLYLSLMERNLSRTIGALHISDGTLRFLLLESVFYNPQRGNMVAIDESEKGLHPDMIKSVAEMMKYAAGTTQIITATHSPHLLNQFELEDVIVFEKDEQNSTQVRRVSEDDFPDYEGEFLPGQMWLSGKIGGKRW